MNKLHQLRKPLLEMSETELRRHVEHIRADRLVSKEKPATKRKKVVASANSRSKAMALLKIMTPAEAKRLARELDNEDAGE